MIIEYWYHLFFQDLVDLTCPGVLFMGRLLIIDSIVLVDAIDLEYLFLLLRFDRLSLLKNLSTSYNSSSAML